MAKLTDILTSSSVVRNESAAEQNTALRVGNVLYSLTQYLQQYTSMADITLQVSGVGATLTLKLQSGDNMLFQKTIALPVASGQQAGILTAEAFAAFQSDISQLQQDLTALFNEKDVLEDRVNVNAENIADLGLALRGKSANSSAYTDPFISLGESTDWSEFSGKLNALSDQKYMGRCRATVSGVTVEIYQFINNFARKDYTQVLLGNVSAVGSGVTFTPDKFNIIHRRRMGGEWLPWQRINDHPIATPDLDGLMSADDKRALTTQGTAISDLRYRLQGRSDMSEKCSAYTDPFISLGDITGWPDFSKKLDAIPELENKQKYMGRCRARVNGITVEVYHFINSFSKNNFSQVVLGNVSALKNEQGKWQINFTADKFNLIHRQYNGNKWTDWQRINDHPNATSSMDGLMSAADKKKLDIYPSQLVLDLGLVDSQELGEQEAAKSEVAGNRNISFIRFKVQEEDRDSLKTTIIMQWPDGIDTTAQLMFTDESQFRRSVTGATGVSGNATHAYTWERTAPHFIEYDKSRRMLQLKDYLKRSVSNEDGVELPLATHTQDGLMSAADKSALTTANTAISELRYRLQGRADMSVNCSAYTDPFISLGDLTNWQDFNTKLNAISGQKYMGRCRAKVDGVTVEVYQFINNFEKNDYTQMLFGNVSAGGSGVIFTPDDFSIIYRQYTEGAWTEWQRMGTATELATLEARIAALEARLS